MLPVKRFFVKKRAMCWNLTHGNVKESALQESVEKSAFRKVIHIFHRVFHRSKDIFLYIDQNDPKRGCCSDNILFGIMIDTYVQTAQKNTARIGQIVKFTGDPKKTRHSGVSARLGSRKLRKKFRLYVRSEPKSCKVK